MDLPDAGKQEKKGSREEEQRALNQRLIKYLYNLTKSKVFLDKYQDTLPLDLYEKTIRNQIKSK